MQTVETSINGETLIPLAKYAGDERDNSTSRIASTKTIANE